jgi:hypothetical protein
LVCSKFPRKYENGIYLGVLDFPKFCFCWQITRLPRKYQENTINFPSLGFGDFSLWLQAALLKKDTWEVFFRVGTMFSKGELKGMDCGKEKRNRSTKEREIKQQQLKYRYKFFNSLLSIFGGA